MKKLALSSLAFALACAWGGSTAQAAITLTLTPSASTVALGHSITLTAKVSGTTTTTALNWYVNNVLNGSLAQGTLTSCTTGTVATTRTCTYNAPATIVPSPNPVTFKIVSLQDNTTSKTATATVTTSIVLSSLSPTGATLALAGKQAFTISISGTNGNSSALNWYVNGVLKGNSTQGTVSGCTGTTTVTCTYTAPALNVPVPNPAVVKVVSAADPTKFKTANVTVTDTNGICESGNESVLSGLYAFNLTGFNSTGFTAVAGSITVDGHGNITGGEADTNGGLGSHAASPVSAGFYSVGADNRGCAMIRTGFGTFNTRFDLGAISSGKATQGRIIEFDPATSSAFVASGQILQQNTSIFSSAVSGSYAFLLTGWSTNPIGPNGAVAGVGRIACDGFDTFSGGAITAGELYCNDRGKLPSGGLPITGVTGGYSSVDAHGRFTMTPTVPGQGAGHISVYLVSTAEGLSVNTDSTTSSPAVAGVAFKQTGGPYSTASLNNKFVLYSNGVNSTTSGKIHFVLAHVSVAGTISDDADYEDDGGTWTHNGTTSSYPYTVLANGRVTTSGGVGYLTAANTAVTVGTDAGEFASFVVPQTVPGGGFTTALVHGAFFGGTTEVVNHSATAEGTMVTLTGSGSPNVSAIADQSATGSRAADAVQTDTVTVAANGTFKTTNNGSQVVGVAIDTTHFLIVSGKSTSYPRINLSGPSTADTVAVSITTPTGAQTVPVKKTLAITAKVTGTTNTALTWTVNGIVNGNSTYGTMTGIYPSYTYTAPTTVPGTATFALTATSDADASKSASFNVTISAGVVVAITTPTSPQSIAVNAHVAFTATVGGTSNTAVTWKVNGVTNGNSTYGTITGSGLSVTYNAPASVPATEPFNVTVTSVEDTTKSASVSVTITSGVAVTVAITSPSNPASVAVGATLSITVSVANAAPAVTWTVNGVANGNSTYGTITGSYPTYTYTPPAIIPGGHNPVTIVATQPGAVSTASLTVTINPSTTAPTAIAVSAGSGATGINMSLPTTSPTLGLAGVGTCVVSGGGISCGASVTGIQVSRSGLATNDCPNATCTIWLLGLGLTGSSGAPPPLATGLTVSVPHGSSTDVPVSGVTAMSPNGPLTDIYFTIVVSGTAALGNRDIVVTIGSGSSKQTQTYVGAIQIVN